MTQLKGAHETLGTAKSQHLPNMDVVYKNSARWSTSLQTTPLLVLENKPQKFYYITFIKKRRKMRWTPAKIMYSGAHDKSQLWSKSRVIQNQEQTIHFCYADVDITATSSEEREEWSEVGWGLEEARVLWEEGKPRRSWGCFGGFKGECEAWMECWTQ